MTVGGLVVGGLVVGGLVVGAGVGSVVGGWMASGEPMTITYYRTRTALAGGSK